jgi:hypothetical protein
MNRKSKVFILGLICVSLFATTRSWSETYNLQLKDANCKVGAVTTCYGNTCVTGSSMCIANPCDCSGGNQE